MLDFSYDRARDILTVEGIKYSGEFFRCFAESIPLKSWFRIIERGDGVIAISKEEERE